MKLTIEIKLTKKFRTTDTVVMNRYLVLQINVDCYTVYRFVSIERIGRGVFHIEGYTFSHVFDISFIISVLKPFSISIILYDFRSSWERVKYDVPPQPQTELHYIMHYIIFHTRVFHPDFSPR